MGRQITIRSGPRSGEKIDVPDTSRASSPTGNVNEDQQLAEEDAGTASNAGMQAQSSDSQNKYQ